MIISYSIKGCCGIFQQLQIKSIMKLRLVFIHILKSLLLTVLPAILIFSSVSAQDTITVRGKVVNGLNEPVANVAVGIEGSFELPRVTDDSGEFVLKTISGDVWLNVSPSGDYKGKRVFLNGREELNIYLTSSSLESGNDEISLLGQGFLKRNIVSSFSTVNSNEILHTPALSVDEYLQGRVPGLHVVNRSGLPGSGAATFLRGVNSLHTDNRPLYVVDGIPQSNVGVFSSNLEGFEHNALLGINTLDISRITVLKDATLTAAYGSRGSNGVVLIETLDPSATETVIDVDLRSGYSLQPEIQIPQMNAGQHKTLASELLFSTGMQEEQIREDYPNLFLTPDDDRFIDYQHNTNWQNYIFSDAAFNNINVKVKGGDEIARYGLSFGYISGDGIIKNTGYDGYNLRFVSLLNIFTWLKMNASASLNYSSGQLKESAKVSQTNPILSSLYKSPMLNPYQYDNKGEEMILLAEVDELGVSNPLAVIENYEAENTNFNFTSNLGFIAQINDNLDFHTNFGLNYNILKEKIFMPNKGMELYYNDEAINVSKATNNSLSAFYSNSYLSFDKDFGDEHHFSSITGINILSNKFELDWALTRNAHENDEYRLLQDGTRNLMEIGGANRLWNWLSIYENLFYSYKDKYLAMASLSFDGSSRVGDNASNTLKVGGVPFGVFYSVGAGWRISHESFLKNISVLEELKLRLTYGQTGNDNIGESTATKYYEVVKFRETTGLYPALVPNEELTYEVVSVLNGGIDLSLIGNRITAKFDIYRSVTDNLLVYAPLDAYFGYNFRPENNGKMENKGLELNLFFRLIDRSKFKWDIETNYSFNKNEILEIKGEKLVNSILGAEVVNEVGEQANSFYGYLFKGVYSTSEEAEQANLLNERMIPYQAGDAIYEDLSGPEGTPDGIINDFDKTTIGSSLPKQFGGVNNTFHYSRWALSTFVQFVQGNELFNYVRYQNENMLGLENQSTRVLDRWQYDGQVTEIPRAVFDDPKGNTHFSDRWIEDGTYLRIKNVTLSYTIPEEFLNFRNAQFYFSANNLFTFSNYLGYDPEFAHSHDHMSQGVDYGLTPQSRQFILGIKLGL